MLVCHRFSVFSRISATARQKKRLFWGLVWTCVWLGGLNAVHAQQAARVAVARTETIVREVQTASFPELNGANIQVKAFSSLTDYFQARFAVGRFLTGRRMNYVLYVNPGVYGQDCPPAAVRAIVAHELAHIAFYYRRKRLKLLGLARLARDGARIDFERGADLEAIARGYAEGLAAYRTWLYAHIPPRAVAAKQRDYFTPAEISTIAATLRTRPERLDAWRKHPPRKL